jgi:hypothetical protein
MYMNKNRVVLDRFYKVHQPWFDCHVTSIRDILHYYGTVVSPYLCYGIGGGINFNYIPVDVTTVCNNPPVKLPFWVIMGSNVTFTDLCHEFNITPYVYRYSNSEEAWSETKKFINDKRPVLIDIVDLFLYKEELGQLNDLPFLQSMFEQVEVPEYINFLTSGSKNLVIGYDNIKDTAILIYTIFLAPIEFPNKILQKLRNAEGAVPPVYSETVVFDVPQSSLPINYLINKGIHKCCLRMTENNMYIENKDGRKYSQGLKGLKQYFSDLSDIQNIIKEASIIKNTFFVSTMLSRGFANRWGAYRFPFGKFLMEASGLTGNKNLKTIGQHYLDLSEKWTRLTDIIGSSVLAGQYGFISENSVRKLIQEVLDGEERNISLLYNEV